MDDGPSSTDHGATARGGTTPTRARAPYRKADVVREAILDATIALLSERPMHDVSIRDIAARADVQHSLVLRHFGTKDALVAEAVRTVTRAYAAVVDATDDGAAGYLDASRHIEGRPHAASTPTRPPANPEWSYHR